MADRGCVVVIGGTAGLGRAVALHYADRGFEVVVAGRGAARADAAATEIGGHTRGLQVDLTRPEEVAERLAGVGPVRHLVISAIERDQNSVRAYDVARAQHLVTLKLVGYTAVVHGLADRLGPESSIVLFGGLAKDRPYPGSTTVTTVNGGIEALVRTLAVELAPVRVNAIHPGIVGDTAAWKDKPEVLARVSARTPIGRPVTTADVWGAVCFLLENAGVNGVNLPVDGGILAT